LQAADGQFIREVENMALAIPRLPSAFSKSIGFTLCGMARNRLPRLDPLFEVFHGDVGPHIPCKIDQNGIDAGAGCQTGQPVVIMLDLCCSFLPVRRAIR